MYTDACKYWRIIQILWSRGRMKIPKRLWVMCSFYPTSSPRANLAKLRSVRFFIRSQACCTPAPCILLLLKQYRHSSLYTCYYLISFQFVCLRFSKNLYDLEGYQGSNSYDAWIIMHRFRLWMIYSITLTKIYWYKLAGYAIDVDQSIPTTFKSPLFIMCTCITAIIILNL